MRGSKTGRAITKQAASSDTDHQAGRRARDAKGRAKATPKARASARRADGRPTRKSQRHVNYVELGSSDDEIGGEPQRATREIGLLFTAADPRYVGKDIAGAGSVILNMDEVRKNLREEKEFACQSRTVWLTTSQMSWPIHAEEDEVVSSTDIEENRLTKRCIAPMISRFIWDRWIDGGEVVSQASLRQTWLFE